MRADDADEALIQGINNGIYMWFAAHVRVSKDGVDLGEDYLGGCCYESAAAFMKPGGYYEDMVECALEDARKELSPA